MTEQRLQDAAQRVGDWLKQKQDERGSISHISSSRGEWRLTYEDLRILVKAAKR